jgi:acetyl esterase/lipase
VPLDRHARRFLEMLAAAGKARGRYEAVEERREALAHLADLVDPPGTVEIGGVRDQLLPVHDGHISLRIYSPLGKPERLLPGMLFFHGGGWVAGSLDTHDGFCRRLSNETGCRVIAVDYRLAPLHPFPYGLADAWAALNHVCRNPRNFGIDPMRLGVAGDSAGGTIAAVLSRMARDAARESSHAPRIAFQLLICPILDVYGQSPARHELAEGYFLDSETLERDLELYVPQGVELTDIRLSPLRAEEFADLPMAFIHTAQFDPFSDEGEAYAQWLGGFGVPVHGRAHSGMIHYFYCMPRMIPYALEAVRIIGNEIRYAVDLPVRERRFHRRIRPELIRA